MADFNFQPNRGAFNLGAVLAGGGRVRDAARTTEEARLIERAQQQAETDRKVDEARMAMLKRTGQETFNADTSVSPLIRALVTGGYGSEYSGATEGQLHTQEHDFRDAAVKAFADGRVNDANAQLVGVAKGPLELTTVKDGNIVRNQYADNGTVAPTDEGRAKITALEALTGERNAHAGVYDAQEAVGGFKPSTATGGRAGTGPAWTDLDPDTLAATFPQIAAVDSPELLPNGKPRIEKGKPTGHVNKALVDVFTRWRNAQAETDPRFNNAAYAKDHFPGGPAATEYLRLLKPGTKPISQADADAANLEQQLGRPLTDAERAQVETGDFNIPATPPPASPVAAAFAGRAPRATDGFESFDALPPEAHASLKPGVKTKFGNGQVWTLVQGKPVRVQ